MSVIENHPSLHRKSSKLKLKLDHICGRWMAANGNLLNVYASN